MSDATPAPTAAERRARNARGMLLMFAAASITSTAYITYRRSQVRRQATARERAGQVAS